MLTFSGHELVVGGHGWNAEHPVLAALLVEGVVCVILDFMTFPCGQQAANLRGYSRTGEPLWVAEHPTNSTTDYYVSLEGVGDDGHLLVGNFAGFRCRVDPGSGRLVRCEFTK